MVSESRDSREPGRQLNKRSFGSYVIFFRMMGWAEKFKKCTGGCDLAPLQFTDDGADRVHRSVD